MASLISRGIELHRLVLNPSPQSDDGGCLNDWLAYEAAIANSITSGTMDPRTASAIFAIAANVRNSASALLALRQDSEETVASLAEKLQDIGLVEPNCE